MDIDAARKQVSQLLSDLESHADHAAANVVEWGPGPNLQVQLWQEEADEKQRYAAALRVVLGLPPRVERVDDDDE